MKDSSPRAEDWNARWVARSSDDGSKSAKTYAPRTSHATLPTFDSAPPLPSRRPSACRAAPGAAGSCGASAAARHRPPRALVIAERSVPSIAAGRRPARQIEAQAREPLGADADHVRGHRRRRGRSPSATFTVPMRGAESGSARCPASAPGRPRRRTAPPRPTVATISLRAAGRTTAGADVPSDGGCSTVPGTGTGSAWRRSARTDSGWYGSVMICASPHRRTQSSSSPSTDTPTLKSAGQVPADGRHLLQRHRDRQRLHLEGIDPELDLRERTVDRDVHGIRYSGDRDRTDRSDAAHRDRGKVGDVDVEGRRNSHGDLPPAVARIIASAMEPVNPGSRSCRASSASSPAAAAPRDTTPCVARAAAATARSAARTASGGGSVPPALAEPARAARHRAGISMAANMRARSRRSRRGRRRRPSRIASVTSRCPSRRSRTVSRSVTPSPWTRPAPAGPTRADRPRTRRRSRRRRARCGRGAGPRRAAGAPAPRDRRRRAPRPCLDVAAEHSGASGTPQSTCSSTARPLPPTSWAPIRPLATNEPAIWCRKP